MTEEELHKLISESIQSLVEKKLCPKGRAYYNRRIAAGEVPSAYLSGRAVKVCKGLMEGDEETVECENCGWEWNLEDGGKEPFLCHKCGHDNTEKYDMNESLRDWFKKEDWVRIDTQGNITGPCGTMKKGQATTRCLPRAKANSLTKAERAATARKKAAADRKGDRVVPNTPKAKVRLEEDCGCNGPKLILKEGQNTPILSEGLKHHIAEGLQLIHNIYRPLSKQYFELFNEARKLYNEGLLSVTEDDIEILESNIGGMFTYKGVEFPIDYILTEEELVAEVDKKKTPPIGKPKRGGSKKFYVYVRKPGGGIKKVSFGDTTGLRAKLNNPQARRAFAARHDCKNKKDRTKASYWSCRLPRYAKLLGFKTTFSGYW
jgi:hypothetical protein